MKSATTIDPGLNWRDTPRFALRRLVDGGRVSEIEFAAEMTGFMEFVRSLPAPAMQAAPGAERETRSRQYRKYMNRPA